MKKIFLLFLLISSLSAFSQDKYSITDKDYNNQEVEMADIMRQNGKIYVVVGVIFVIFAGITVYLLRLDKKVTQLEKELKAEKTL